MSLLYRHGHRCIHLCCAHSMSSRKLLDVWFRGPHVHALLVLCAQFGGTGGSLFICVVPTQGRAWGPALYRSTNWFCVMHALYLFCVHTG